jgi:hypothetical protein
LRRLLLAEIVASVVTIMLDVAKSVPKVDVAQSIAVEEMFAAQ